MFFANKIELKFSKIFAVLLTLIHAGAFVCVLFLPWSLEFKVVVGCGLLINWVYLLYTKVFLQGANVVRELWVEKGSSWNLRLKNDIIASQVKDFVFISNFLILLNFSAGKSYLKRSVLLFPDMVDSKVRRRLRVYLRWGAQRELSQ